MSSRGLHDQAKTEHATGGDAKRVLRCALVGTGGVAHLHAHAIAAHPSTVLSSVTDLSRQRADQFAASWGEPTVYDVLGDLLRAERPDVLLICTPPGAHLEQAEAALAVGAHVIVEKPAGCFPRRIGPDAVGSVRRGS